MVYLQQTYQGVAVYNKIGVYIFRHDTLIQKRLDYIPKPGAKAGAKASATPTIGRSRRYSMRAGSCRSLYHNSGRLLKRMRCASITHSMRVALRGTTSVVTWCGFRWSRTGH